MFADGMVSSDDVREGNGKPLLLQSLEKEVLSLRESENGLIQELQRRCNKIIDLEVRLDQERERANRLERERTEEDEALSGELREIMATVAADSVAAAASSTASETDFATGSDPPFDSRAINPGGQSSSGAPDKAEEAAPGGGGGAGGGSGFFTEWRLRRARGRRDNNSGSPTGDGGRVGNGGKSGATGGGGTVAASAVEKLEEGGEAKEGQAGEGSGGGGGGESESQPNGGRGREQAAGALRTRVVELELQRAEAEDQMREKTDRSIRLEVQVEQLKNVVQSLSHASAQEDAQGQKWGGTSPASAMGKTPGAIDFGPLLGGVPGVDPQVLLRLLRTPWADGVIEGVRKEEACFEWQGRGSRGEWSSKLENLPNELSSLPYHSAGPPSPPPPLRPTKSSSPLSSPGGPAAAAAAGRKKEPGSLGVASVEPGRAGGAGSGGAGAGGLRDKIEGAVAAFGAAGRGKGARGARTVTDEGMTFRFDLDSVGLPSDHWEWVGGWMVDSEMEASADQDGWIYGRAASEISETALGRRRSTTSGDGGDISAAQAANATVAAAPKTKEAGATASEQEQEQGNSPSGSRRRAGATPAAPSAGDSDQQRPRATDGGGDPRGRETDRGEGGDGRGGLTAADGGEIRGAAIEGLWLRRRRLVRVRMVRRVDGARESTTSILEMMRRLCSLEILVRKLSRQVVSQQRQITGLEGQVAYLAPLQPKLKMACALGRKDRLRGNALQGRLVEAQNELKVLRRCLAAANTNPRSAPPQPQSQRQPSPTPGPAVVGAASGRQAPKAAGRLSAQELANGGRTASDEPLREGEEEEDGEGGEESTESSAGGGREGWGWVGAALARRSRASPAEEEEEENRRARVGSHGDVFGDVFGFPQSGRGSAAGTLT